MSAPVDPEAYESLLEQGLDLQRRHDAILESRTWRLQLALSQAAGSPAAVLRLPASIWRILRSAPAAPSIPVAQVPPVAGMAALVASARSSSSSRGSPATPAFSVERTPITRMALAPSAATVSSRPRLVIPAIA